MRTPLLLLAFAALCGCTSSRDSRLTPAAQTAHDVPVVIENPTLSERLRSGRQQKAEQESTARVEVEVGGNIVR